MQVTTNIPMSRREAYQRGFAEGVNESLKALNDVRKYMHCMESAERHLNELAKRLINLITKQATE